MASFRVRCMVVSALVFSPSAWAHYPHDVTMWAAVSPDPDDFRIASALEPIDLDLLGRSENGLDWAARLVPSRDGMDRSAAFLTSQRLVYIAGVGSLLVSEDAGDTFVEDTSITDQELTRVAVSPTVLEDGTAFVSGETAIWRTEDAGLTWEPVFELEGGFQDLDVSPEFAEDGRVCALSGHQVSCSADRGETWATHDFPPNAWRMAVGADGRVWCAVREEGLFLSPDDGETWDLAGFFQEDVTTVSELQGGLVMVSTGLVAGWRSEDGGATWAPFDGQTVEVDQPADGVNFFDFVEGPNGDVYMAAWYGLAVSHDRGQTFSFYNIEPIENTHSMTLTRGFDGGLSAWIGTYGGGPILVDLDTLETEIYTGMRDGFTRNAVVTRNYQDDGIAVQDMGYQTWITTDWGESWRSIADDFGSEEIDMSFDVKGVSIGPDTVNDPFLLAIVGEGHMEFRVSTDWGLTWQEGEQDPDCDDRGIRTALSPRWPDESRAWAACGSKVYESDDRGATWWVLGDTGALFIYDMVERTDGSLLVGTTDGLWLLDESGAVQLGFDDTFVVGLAASVEDGDDTAFALVPTEGWMRSEDGGDTWDLLEAPTADVPRRISMSTTFSQDGTVAVAGYGGAWVSEDRGESWRSIYAMEVYECDHDAWATTGDWEWVDWTGASRSRVVESETPGSTTTFQFQGIAIDLEAPANDSAATIRVTLDGSEEEIVTPTDGSPVWSASGLEEGWHTLTIEAVSGTVILDDVRITRMPMIEAEGERPDPPNLEEGCGGCGGRGGAAMLLAPVLLVGRRRRSVPRPLR